MENLGPGGPGLLSITSVPNASIHRRNLLPLARKLALLNPDDRKRLLKEHHLGSDVSLKNPERNVSSFAMQLRYKQGLESTQCKFSSRADDNVKDQDLGQLPDNEFKNLGNMFKELGFCMIELGLCLARICDKAIGGQELEQSLLESSVAKGRLIHYHSTLDSVVLKEAGRKGRSSKKKGNPKSDQGQCIRSEKQTECTNVDGDSDEAGISGTHSNLWQQWHYDYGVFTVLTDPFFILPYYSSESRGSDQGCPSPGGHTYLQILDPNKNKVRMVKSSPESFIIQPAWNKTFSISDYPTENCNLSGQGSGAPDEENPPVKLGANKLAEAIQKMIPPLSSRLNDGMTFAEFSHETTRQYYGGGGLQPNR
ncbi:Fe2OG dioxygenase domain-containing protein [Citrus sinensis]|uniref:Fe2OG dioxygenase domain-containing protein n=1 Tax=Citrus sinensis TaxID=2711 RepID=A0ACB8MJX2_CITSI|nr:Fe2OG dioxygenase domain-containing protein [Citrus sinensis]